MRYNHKAAPATSVVAECSTGNKFVTTSLWEHRNFESAIRYVSYLPHSHSRTLAQASAVDRDLKVCDRYREESRL